MKSKKPRVIWCGEDASGRMWQLFEYKRYQITQKGLKPVKFIEAKERKK